ncbi:MAG TPA: MBL fold metallo-hydrolase [Gaiellaceae bacterium]|jgi:L-ascorbate metabolism protein UlaG (beta-lactamase superfamily)
MNIRWYGQSAFSIRGKENDIFIDPFGDVSAFSGHGVTWNYPAIEDANAELLLITHDHLDHNGVEVVGGEPVLIAQAGTHESPIGEVVGIASEHDDVAGTQRGANVIFRFALDGITFAHFGDFGQRALRPEQRAALGDVDVVFFPAGGGPTTPVAEAATLLRELAPRVVIPMHYRTPQIGFLDPPEPFFDALGFPVREASGAEAELELPAKPEVLKLTLT